MKKELKAFRQVQFAANLAIIVIAILLGIITIKLYLSPVSQPENASTTTRRSPAIGVAASSPEVKTQINPLGQTIPLGNIDWDDLKP